MSDDATLPVPFLRSAEIPPELSDRPSAARRVLLPAATIARWAYCIRRLHETAEAVATRELEEEYGERERSRAAQQRIAADLERARLSSDLVEVAYQQARLNFVAASVRPALAARLRRREDLPASIRQAVKRHRHVWELAEQQVLDR